jgi:hypothetical protein
MRAVAGAPRAALFAGLLAALATAVLPVAAAVAVGAGLALAAARRWRGLLEAAIGLGAGLAPTLLWRERALGTVTLTLGHPSWGAFDAAHRPDLRLVAVAGGTVVGWTLVEL